MRNSSSGNEIQALKNKIKELEAIVKHYEELFKLSQKKKFGISSEKSLYDQLTIEGETDETAVANPESDNEPHLCDIVKEYTRKKRTRKEGLPDGLHVEELTYELADEDKICPHCGTEAQFIGNDIREELVVEPAKVMLRKHINPKHKCRGCENNERVTIIKAATPNPVIKGSFASPEAVAYTAHQKFVMGVPLYRQEQEWQRKGVLLPRQTLANWLISVSENWLCLITDELKRRLLSQTVAHADETTFQVLNEEFKTPQSKSYLWVYRTGGDVSEPIVLAEYKPNRKAKNPAEFLANFKGYLHTDGYEAYHKLPDDIVVVGCWAHVRRRWDSALKMINPSDRDGTQELKGKRYCDKMFDIERDIADLPSDEKYEKRLKVLKPVMDEFFAWVDTIRTTPKSQFGKAIGYMHSQKKYLQNVLLDGRLELSNNRAERTIKPFVISRKNFLFANTVRGANAAANIFSLVETAKETGVDPFEYLSYVFKVAPNVNMSNPENIEALLPAGFKNSPIKLP
jgi:transposase